MTRTVETDDPCGAPKAAGPCPSKTVKIAGDGSHAWCADCGVRRIIDVDGNPAPWLGWEGVGVVE